MNNKMPLVSIVINNYNYGSFLNQSIDSALDQTYDNVEVIVVDDGSNDHSSEIIQSYGNKITPVLKKNGGQASAFNSGFQASNGDIICLLDADDVVFPNKAEKVADAFTTHPEISWFFHESIPADSETFNHVQSGDLQFLPSRTSDIRGLEKINYKNELLNAKLPGFAPSTSNLCFSRSLLEKFFPLPEVRGYSGLAICDVYLRIIAVWLGIGIKSPESLGLFRLHEKNLYTTQELTNKRRTYCEILLVTAYHMFSNYPELSRLSRKLFSKGICMYWNVKGEQFNYDHLIRECHQYISRRKQFNVFSRAMMYSLKLQFSDLV